MFAWAARNWGHVVGASLAVVFALAFSPMVLALEFGGNEWSFNDDTGGAVSIGDETVSSFALFLQSSGQINGTVTITSTNISATGFDEIAGVISGLAGNNLIGEGTFSISVIVSGDLDPEFDGNMFDNTASPFTGTIENPSLTSQDVVAGELTVTITLTFVNAQFQTQPSSNWAVFNFSGRD